MLSSYSTEHTIYWFQGRTRGGAEVHGPPEGGTNGGGSFNITSACISLPQAIYILHSTLHCIALHSPILKDSERKKLYYDSQQNPSKLCLIKYCIKYPCFPFWKLMIFICGFSAKVTHTFLASETTEKWRCFKGTSNMLLYKWRVTWNYVCIPFKSLKKL